MRVSSSVELMAVSVPVVLQLDILANEVQEDSQSQEIIQELERDPSRKANYKMVNGQLLFKDRLLLKHSKLIPSILQEGHDSKVGGHSRFLKITNVLLQMVIRKE